MEGAGGEISGRSVAALVLGVAGLTACPVAASIAAILLGMGERNGVGRAGFWLGWIGLGVSVLAVLASALLFLLGLIFAGGSLFAEELV
jgi:hypothetical protein